MNFPVAISTKIVAFGDLLKDFFFSPTLRHSVRNIELFRCRITMMKLNAGWMVFGTLHAAHLAFQIGDPLSCFFSPSGVTFGNGFFPSLALAVVNLIILGLAYTAHTLNAVISSFVPIELTTLFSLFAFSA